MDSIRQALATEAMAVVTGAEVAFAAENIIAENMSKPESDGNWAQFFFKPAQPRCFSLGSSGMDEVRGVFLVNLHYKLDTGGAAGASAVGTFRRAFTAGRRLIFGGQEVQIHSCGANLGRIVDTWYRADIHIEWVAYLQRGVA